MYIFNIGLSIDGVQFAEDKITAGTIEDAFRIASANFLASSAKLLSAGELNSFWFELAPRIDPEPDTAVLDLYRVNGEKITIDLEHK